MNNAEYWARRFKIMEDALKDQSFEYVKNLEEMYNMAIKDIEKDIRTWYQRLADNNGISYAEAQKLLTSKELEEFKWDVEQYIKHAQESETSGQWVKQLENASARVHISRWDSLKVQLQHKAETLLSAAVKATEDASKKAYVESFYRTAFETQKSLGAGWDIQALDERRIEKVLSKPWTADNQTFRARCWTDKNKLVQTVNQELTRISATGATPDEAIERIAKQFKTSRSNAARVVMTESAYFASAAQKDCFNELDVEQYQIIGTLDGHTCSICGDMDSKVFNMSDFVVGSTAPPFHPWCRCCTAPYFADMEGIGQRIARDIETGKAYYLPADTTYEQWKQMQDEKYGKGSVDRTRKKAYNESTDKKQYDRYKSVLRELTPESFEDFQNIKYSNPQRWSQLKHQYRILNQYKIDSGHLTAQQMLELDEKVITEKRDNFTSKFKKSGNIAGAYIDDEINNFYISHSKIDDDKTATKYKGNSKFVTLKEKRRFTYIDVAKSNGEIRTGTYSDTEAKLFEKFADMYDEKPFSSITMLSERGMCESCKGVMAQFKEQYPDVTVNVISNKKVEGDVWKYRRRKK